MSSYPDNRNKAIVRAAMPGTIGELVKASGLSEVTVRRWIKSLRADNDSYVVEWFRTLAAPTPCHGAGKGVDAPKKKARGHSAWCKKWRRRQKIEATKRKAEIDSALAQNVIPQRQQSPWSALGL